MENDYKAWKSHFLTLVHDKANGTVSAATVEKGRRRREAALHDFVTKFESLWESVPPLGVRVFRHYRAFSDAIREEHRKLTERKRYKIRRGRRKIDHDIAQKLLEGIELAMAQGCLDDLYTFLSVRVEKVVRKGILANELTMPALSRDPSEKNRWAYKLKHTLKINIGSKDKVKTIRKVTKSLRKKSS